MQADEIAGYILHAILEYVAMTGDKDPCIVMPYKLFALLAQGQRITLTMNRHDLFGFQVVCAAEMEPGSVVIGRKRDYLKGAAVP